MYQLRKTPSRENYLQVPEIYCFPLEVVWCLRPCYLYQCNPDISHLETCPFTQAVPGGPGGICELRIALKRLCLLHQWALLIFVSQLPNSNEPLVIPAVTTLKCNIINEFHTAFF